MTSDSGPDIDGHRWHSVDYVAAWIREHEHDVSPAYIALQKRRLDAIINVIHHDRDQALSMLDLGAGWGRLARQLLDAFPKAIVVAHDFSEPMREASLRNLTTYADRIQYVGGDLEQPGVISKIGIRFDIIVTSHTLHHVSELRLGSLYREIYEALHPGGVFINLDRSRRRSVAILKAMERSRPGRLLASSIRRWLHTGHDTGTHGSSRSGQLRLLRRAGFNARSQRAERLLLTVATKPSTDGRRL